MTTSRTSEFVNTLSTTAATLALAIIVQSPPATAQDIAASYSQAPWQVSLWNDDHIGHYCGGALIAPEWVVSAANCFQDSNGNPYYADISSLDAILGTMDLTNGGERIDVGRVIVHPDYDTSNHSNNIALVKLSTKATMGRILDLPMQDRVVVTGELLQIAGWGHTSDDKSDEYQKEMKILTLPVVAQDLCNAPQGYDGTVSDDSLCAGFIEGGPDACEGFSGSVAVHAEDAVPAAAGIAGWGFGCGTPDKVGVYTRVSAFSDWIDATIEGD